MDRQTQSVDVHFPVIHQTKCGVFWALNTPHFAFSPPVNPAENELAYLGLNIFTEERLGTGDAGVPLQKLFRCEKLDRALAQRGAL